jgi:hypothetical protein
MMMFHTMYLSRNKCSKIVSVHFSTTRFAELYFKETVVRYDVFLPIYRRTTN